jgi:predicted transcriptional regulator
VVLGLLIVVVRGELFTGFWAAVVGLFLFDSARGIIREVNDQCRLLVSDVMQLPISIEPETTVLHLVDHVLPLHRRAVFPVAKDRKMYGILVLEDVKSVQRDAWNATTIGKVMRPVREDHFVDTRTHFVEAKEIMSANGIGAVAVIDSGGDLVGFLHAGTLKRRR